MTDSKTPVQVAVTGAAGQIGYQLLFRIASGQLLGPDQPVVLRLLEVEPAMNALQGVVMELDDCAFPLLAGVETVESGKMTKDLALLVGPNQEFLTTQDFLSAIDENLQKEMS